MLGPRQVRVDPGDLGAQTLGRVRRRRGRGGRGARGRAGSIRTVRYLRCLDYDDGLLDRRALLQAGLDR